MFQIRGKGDGRAYRPGRDIYYLFEPIASRACHRLARDTWHDVIRDYAAYSGLSESDLVPGATALKLFYELSSKVGVTDFATAWVDSGMASLPKPTLMALMFELGVGLCATWFNCSREVTIAGQSAHGQDKVGELADRMASAVGKDLPHERARAAGEIDELRKEG